MATLYLRLHVANKIKRFRSTRSLVTVGRSKSCGMILPFPWLCDVHLEIEAISADMIRVRLGDVAAHAESGGQALTTAWMEQLSPVRISIATPRGHSIVLEASVNQPNPDMAILREPGVVPSEADFEAEPDMVSLSRIPSSSGMQSSGGELSVADWETPIGAERAGMTGGEKASIWLASVLMILLVGGAIGINRFRHIWADELLTKDTKFVGEQMSRVEILLANQDYVGAKRALDKAEPVARQHPELAETVASIVEYRSSPALTMGVAGAVEVDGQWLPPEKARAWRAAREKDDPKIAQLEQQAAVAMQANNYEVARYTLEEALRIIDAQPVKAHPRRKALVSQLELARSLQVAAEMTAKGMVQHEGKWVKPEEKARIENTAKGLVEFEGEWMTRDEMAAVKARGGTGKVLYEGRWMTVEKKMEMQGYVQLDGVWVRQQERDTVLAKRQAAKDKAEATERDALNRKTQAERAEKLKSSAYEHTHDLVRQKLPTLKLVFSPITSAGVHVAFDEGWYIVKGEFEADGGGVKRAYYCKLRALENNAWSVETLVFPK